MKKRLIAALMVSVMALSSAACGNSSTGSSGNDPSEKKSEEEEAAEAEDHSLAYAELGEGVWAIDYYMLESQYLVEGLGSSFTYTSSDFTVDKMQSLK